MLTQLTDTLTQLITNLYVATGLVGIVIAMSIESCCIPLPSELVMPLAGVMIATSKILQGVNSWVALLLVALAGAVGCLIGSIAAYGIGYSGGRPLLLKYGRYVLISQHDADKSDQFFRRWGSATTFFSRLLPVIRTYISLPAGISRMPFAKFCLYTLLGSFPWCLLLAYIGYVLGNHLDKLSPIFHDLDVVIVVVLVVLVVLYVWRHIRNDRKARAEHAEAEAIAAASTAKLMTPQNSWGQQSWGQGQMLPQPGQPQQGWGQPSSQQGWNQPQSPSQAGWGQPQSPQQGEGQFQQPWPQTGGDDRTVRRP